MTKRRKMRRKTRRKKSRKSIRKRTCFIGDTMPLVWLVNLASHATAKETKVFFIHEEFSSYNQK